MGRKIDPETGKFVSDGLPRRRTMNIYADPELFNELEIVAKTYGMSISALCNMLLRKGLEIFRKENQNVGRPSKLSWAEEKFRKMLEDERNWVRV
ncbi:MAG: hypothetical protein QXN23_05750 [Candidatus Caldarchaeum sp.]